MKERWLISVCILISLYVWAQEPSLFEGLKNMMPELIVKDLETLKPDDLAAAKRIFKLINKSNNVSELVMKESPALFTLVRDMVHAARIKKNETFSQFLPETKTFIGKLQDILTNAIEETSALYKLEKPEVKENLRTIFPKVMFIIEHPTFKSDLIALCCCCCQGGGVSVFQVEALITQNFSFGTLVLNLLFQFGPPGMGMMGMGMGMGMGPPMGFGGGGLLGLLFG